MFLPRLTSPFRSFLVCFAYTKHKKHIPTLVQKSCLVKKAFSLNAYLYYHNDWWVIWVNRDYKQYTLFRNKDSASLSLPQMFWTSIALEHHFLTSRANLGKYQINKCIFKSYNVMMMPILIFFQTKLHDENVFRNHSCEHTLLKPRWWHTFERIGYIIYIG